MEIAQGIHMLPGTVGTRPLQLYLLRGSQRTVLLDSGCAPDPERRIFPQLASLGVKPDDIDLVINTHPDLDHSGGNHAVKIANPRVLLADRELIEDPQMMWNRSYNAYSRAHDIRYSEASSKWIFEMLGHPQQIDFTWRGGEKLRLAPDWVAEIHHEPGHSAGHLPIFDCRSGVMLSGDAVQGAVYLDMGAVQFYAPRTLRSNRI